jgi:hypothetical protein
VNKSIVHEDLYKERIKKQLDVAEEIPWDGCMLTDRVGNIWKNIEEARENTDAEFLFAMKKEFFQLEIEKYLAGKLWDFAEKKFLLSDLSGIDDLRKAIQVFLDQNKDVFIWNTDIYHKVRIR